MIISKWPETARSAGAVIKRACRKVFPRTICRGVTPYRACVDTTIEGMQLSQIPICNQKLDHTASSYNSRTRQKSLRQAPVETAPTRAIDISRLLPSTAAWVGRKPLATTDEAFHHKFGKIW